MSDQCLLELADAASSRARSDPWRARIAALHHRGRLPEPVAGCGLASSRRLVHVRAQRGVRQNNAYRCCSPGTTPRAHDDARRRIVFHPGSRRACCSPRPNRLALQNAATFRKEMKVGRRCGSRRRIANHPSLARGANPWASRYSQPVAEAVRGARRSSRWNSASTDSAVGIPGVDRGGGGHAVDVTTCLPSRLTRARIARAPNAVRRAGHERHRPQEGQHGDREPTGGAGISRWRVFDDIGGFHWPRQRRHNNADVVDAWYDPSPRVVKLSSA